MVTGALLTIRIHIISYGLGLHHGRRVDSAVSTPYRSISAAVDGGLLHGGEWNPSGATTVVAVQASANHRIFALLAGALHGSGC